METPETTATRAENRRRAPGPRGHFLLGSLGERRRDPLGFFLTSALEYGDVVRYRMATRTVYLVTGPEPIQRVLMDSQRRYVKGFGYDKMEQLLGNGLLNSDGDFWRRQRRLAQPAFHRHKIAELVNTMSSCAGDMLDRWDERVARTGGDALAPGARFDLAREVMTLTLRIASLTLLGTDVSSSANEVGQALTRLIHDANRAILSLVDIRSWVGGTPRFRRDRAQMNEVVYGIIADRRKLPADRRPHDLLSMLMEACDEETGESMSDQQLRDEVMTFFVAGHETTANALAWIAYLLSKHPQTAARVAAEADSVLGPLGGRAPGFEDVAQLTYSHAVVSEAMRLYPPAWILSREAIAEDELAGYRIEPRSLVVISPYALHHHPKYWENPEGFDPERFLGERGEKLAKARFTYLPFGGGPRQCIGQVFAMTEAQLVTAMIARRFHVDLAPGQRVEPDPLITLRPKNGVLVSLRRRESRN